MNRTATRLVCSYPADLSDWGRHRIDSPSFRAYLRKAHHATTEGETWSEFVGVGCCGDALDVPLRVERIEGGERIGPETAIEFTVREACGLEGGWQVQSAGGPS